MSRSTGKLKATAHHEAGHAVAQFSLGRRIDRVTVIPNGQARSLTLVQARALPSFEPISVPRDVQTLRERNAAEDDIICALAGPVAEARVRGAPGIAGASADHAEAVDLALLLWRNEKVAETYITFLETRTHELIDVHWYLVVALADSLAAGRTLSGAATQRFIREVVWQQSKTALPWTHKKTTVRVHWAGDGSKEPEPLTFDPLEASNVTPAGWRNMARQVGTHLPKS